MITREQIIRNYYFALGCFTGAWAFESFWLSVGIGLAGFGSWCALDAVANWWNNR